MWIWTTNLLAVAALLCGAASAGAFSFTMTPRGPTTGLQAGDEVILDVYVDAEPGLELLSVGVLYRDNGTITYDGPDSAALAPTGPGTSGAQPSYILYGPASMGNPATALYPQQTPYWLNWPGIVPAGSEQVNINYAAQPLSPTSASGTGIYLASLLFRIEPGFFISDVRLCTTCGGNVIQADGEVVGPGQINLSSPVFLFGVPEPTTAMLIGSGVILLAATTRRRA